MSDSMSATVVPLHGEPERGESGVECILDPQVGAVDPHVAGPVPAPITYRLDGLHERPERVPKRRPPAARL